MLAKTGLLVVSNPNRIGKILSCIQKSVQNTLYINILTSDWMPHKAATTVPKYSQTISGIYSQVGFKLCQVTINTKYKIYHLRQRDIAATLM